METAMWWLPVNNTMAHTCCPAEECDAKTHEPLGRVPAEPGCLTVPGLISKM